MNKEMRRKRSKLGRYREVFVSCPNCGCKDLIECLGDLLCTRCDWNTIELTVEAANGDLWTLFGSVPIKNVIANKDTTSITCESDDDSAA